MNGHDIADGRADGDVARALRALPTLPAPPALAARIDALVACAAAGEPDRGRLARVARLAVAAGLLIAVGAIALRFVGQPLVTAPSLPAATQALERAADDRIEALMARSAYLESMLADVPRNGRVRRVGTASTITALEDRVALIDARLSEPAIAADPGGRAVLWRERVGLMDTLLALQARPAASVTL